MTVSPKSRPPHDDDFELDSGSQRKRRRVNHDDACTEQEVQECDRASFGNKTDSETTNVSLPPYSLQFASGLFVTGMSFLNHVHSEITDSNREPLAALRHFSVSLRRHLQITEEHGTNVRVEKYAQEEMFFTNVGHLTDLVLRWKHDIVDQGGATFHTELAAICLDLLESAIGLARRVIRILSRVIETRLSRRDSLQPGVEDDGDKLPLARWLTILSRLTADEETRSIQLFSRMCRLKAPSLLIDWCRKEFVGTRSIAGEIIETLQTLIRNIQNVNGAWNAIYEVCLIAANLFDNKSAEARELVLIIKRAIIPRLCDASTRDVPRGMYERIVNIGAGLIYTITNVNTNEMDAVVSIYRSMLQNECDALLLNEAAPTPDAMLHTCDERRDLLPEIFVIAWKLHACKSLLFTDIIDARRAGADLLRQTLLGTHECHKQESLDHPAIRYIARYLRTNEIPSYIVSAHSHASIVYRSETVITFLAATGNYTDHETDIIWRACTTRTEADFVKASVYVLQSAYDHLPSEHMQHVAELFKTVPLGALCQPLSEFFDYLLHRMHKFCGGKMDAFHHKACVQLAMDVLERMTGQELTPESEGLFYVAAREIRSCGKMTAEDREMIVDRCIPWISQTSTKKHAGFLVLRAVLQHGNSDTEIRSLCKKISVSKLILLLHDFAVRTNVENSLECRNLAAFASGFESIVKMLQYEDVSSIEMLRATLCDRILTNLDVSHAYRDLAWTQLGKLASRQDFADSTQLLSFCLVRTAVSKDISFATTAMLVEMSKPLFEMISIDCTKEESSSTLCSPIWTFISACAVESHHDNVAAAAASILCQSIPNLSRKDSFPPHGLPFIADVFRALVERLLLNSSVESVGLPALVLCCRGLNLLHLIRGQIRNSLNACDAQSKRQGEAIFSGHYESLNAFLDKPDPLGMEAYRFLLGMAPPSQTLDKLAARVSHDTDLLNQTSSWRIRHSIHLLRLELQRRLPLKPQDMNFVTEVSCMCARKILNSPLEAYAGILSDLCRSLADFLEHCEHQQLSPTYTPRGQILQPNDASKLVTKLISAFETPGLTGSNGSWDLHLAIHAALLRIIISCEDAWHVYQTFPDLTRLHGMVLLCDDAKVCACMAELIMKTCQHPEAHTTIVDYYWNTLLSLLDAALLRSSYTERFFELMQHILALKFDSEARACQLRHTISAFTKKLINYRHIESFHLPKNDQAAMGLLKLVNAAVTILSNLSKSVRSTTLASDVFEHLLFPEYQDMSPNTTWPLLSQEARGLAYELVRASCRTAEDASALSLVACTVLQVLPPSLEPFMTLSTHGLRCCDQPAGLTNLGMTCYMNSLIQQLYANIHFRKFIFETPIEDSENKTALKEVQQIFADLQDAQFFTVSTSKLAVALNVAPTVQDDVHGFYTVLLAKLEEEIRDPARRGELSKIFGGRFLSQIKGSCGHISTCSEAFQDISITVNNQRSLEESLHEFVQGEPMQGANQYKCLSCDPTNGGRLVDAMKRTCLETIPDHLNLCLKRFTWEAMQELDGKINDRFEFPLRIDMSRYTRGALENPSRDMEADEFDLVGVIVHMGTLEFGHYWSYVRLPCQDSRQNIWYRLEDNKVQQVEGNGEEVQRQCFGMRDPHGGRERSDNAYFLVYQRISSVDQQTSLGRTLPPCPNSGVLPIALELPSSLATPIERHRAIRYHARHLLDADFSQLVVWLIQKIPQWSEDSEIARPRTYQDVEAVSTDIARLSASTLLRMIPLARGRENVVMPLITAIETACKQSASIGALVISYLCENPDAYSHVWRCAEDKSCHIFADFLIKRLEQLRERQHVRYKGLLEKVLHIHAKLYTSEFGLFHDSWTPYFGFLTAIVQFGSREASMILDKFCIGTITAAMCAAIGEMPSASTSQYKIIAQRAELGTLDLSPLFRFLSSLFDRNVDRRNCPSNYDNQSARQTLPNGRICLTKFEWDMIYARTTGKDPSLVIVRASKYSDVAMEWADFAPGHLIGHLVRGHPSDVHVQDLLCCICDHLDREDSDVLPWLQLALQCLDLDDTEVTQRLLVQIAGILVKWDDIQVYIMHFFRDAYQIVANEVLRSLTCWILPMLTGRCASTRLDAFTFLEEHLFEVQSELEHSMLACTRIHATTNIVRLIMASKDQSRPKSSDKAYMVLQAAMKYYYRWKEELDSIIGNDLAHSITVELDASRQVFSQLQSHLEDFSELRFVHSIDEDDNGEDDNVETGIDTEESVEDIDEDQPSDEYER